MSWTNSLPSPDIILNTAGEGIFLRTRRELGNEGDEQFQITSKKKEHRKH
jgi:hypothetical protein